MSKPKVLIVDDQASIRSFLKLVVEELNGDVVGEAENGEEAIELFSSLEPNIVLLDINMPKMDGVEALKGVMAISREPLVIMLTSQNTMDVVKECLSIGAKNFLLKNNSPEVLAKEIHQSWLAHRKASVSKGTGYGVRA